MSGENAATPAADDERTRLVTVDWDWARGKWSGVPGEYSCEHRQHFAGRLSLNVTDALVPMAYRDPARRAASRPPVRT